MTVDVAAHPHGFGVITGNRVETGKTNRLPCLQPDFCVTTSVATQKPGFMQDVRTIVLTGLNFLRIWFDFSRFFANFSVSFLDDFPLASSLLSSRINSVQERVRNVSSGWWLRLGKSVRMRSISALVLDANLCLGILPTLWEAPEDGGSAWAGCLDPSSQNSSSESELVVIEESEELEEDSGTRILDLLP